MGDVIPFPPNSTIEFEGLGLWKAARLAAILRHIDRFQMQPMDARRLIRISHEIDEALEALHDLHPHISPYMSDQDRIVFEFDNELTRLRTSLWLQLRNGTFFIGDVDISRLKLIA